MKLSSKIVNVKRASSLVLSLIGISIFSMPQIASSATISEVNDQCGDVDNDAQQIADCIMSYENVEGASFSEIEAAVDSLFEQVSNKYDYSDWWDEGCIDGGPLYNLVYEQQVSTMGIIQIWCGI